MPDIFISYRREDSAGYAGRISAWLKKQIGEDRVFIDIDAIAPGADYGDVIHRTLASSQLVLVIIGPQWGSVRDKEGRRRLEQPDDLVYAEVSAALSRGIRVVPVLVAGAVIPPESDLPPPLNTLHRLNALQIHERFFDQSMAWLSEHFRDWGISLIPSASREFADAAPSRTKSKVCLLGAPGVGKTSLVRKYVSSLFTDSYVTTIGVKIDRKTLSFGAAEITLMIWDFAGEEEGFPLKLNKVRDSSGIILVADGCRVSTLDTAINLRRRIYHEIGPVPSVLAVNKVDLHEEWQVSMDSLEAYDRMGLTTFTTSAKTGKAVEFLFLHLAREIMAAQAREPDNDAD